MHTTLSIVRLASLTIATVALTACANVDNPFKRGDSAAAPAAGSSPAPAPAPAAPAAPKGKVAWMNDQGEVTDSKNVEAGYGTKVKGLEGWEGEITGKPAPGSKFTQLQIGMSRAQAYSIVGQPSDQGAYITGKAFIPFYYGSDRYRYEAAYKGMGRLIFAGSGGFDSNTHLVWIIHNKTDSGFR
jgi:hypothetical protein